MKLKIRALDRNGREVPCRITIQRLTFDEEQYTEGLLRRFIAKESMSAAWKTGSMI